MHYLVTSPRRFRRHSRQTLKIEIYIFIYLQVHYNAEQEIEKIVALDPLKIELPPSEEELALINRQELEQRHQEWMAHQSNQRYSIGDAIRDFFEALRNFKI